MSLVSPNVRKNLAKRTLSETSIEETGCWRLLVYAKALGFRLLMKGSVLGLDLCIPRKNKCVKNKNIVRVYLRFFEELWGIVA